MTGHPGAGEHGQRPALVAERDQAVEVIHERRPRQLRDGLTRRAVLDEERLVDATVAEPADHPPAGRDHVAAGEPPGAVGPLVHPLRRLVRRRPACDGTAGGGGVQRLGGALTAIGSAWTFHAGPLGRQPRPPELRLRGHPRVTVGSPTPRPRTQLVACARRLGRDHEDRHAAVMQHVAVGVVMEQVGEPARSTHGHNHEVGSLLMRGVHERHADGLVREQRASSEGLRQGSRERFATRSPTMRSTSCCSRAVRASAPRASGASALGLHQRHDPRQHQLGAERPGQSRPRPRSLRACLPRRSRAR